MDDGAFSESELELKLELGLDAPDSDALRVTTGRACPAPRPALLYRLNSDRLRVRANAKLFRDRLISGSMVKIEVGPDKREWTIPKNLLAHHSEILEQELQSDGRDRVEKIELHDYDPAGFELFVKFIFQGKLDDVSDMADDQKWDYAVACFQLWRICYRFEMYPLANAASDQYRRGLHEAELVPDAHEIDEIYRQSPAGSPFRKLMTSIAARQIMDPENDRDVQSYSECFKDNPQFAIDLITAIKQGTGGILFVDPTDERSGNTCEYHDHEVAPNCHVKGKGVKQVSKINKAVPRLQNPPPRRESASYDPRTKSDFRLHQAPQPPPAEAPVPVPPALKARPQDEVGSAGPLRRRLTSPASSTINLNIENATASPPTPKTEREKFRKAPPQKKQRETPVLEEPEEPALHQALDVHHQSSEEDRRHQDSHQYPDNTSSSSGRSEPSTKECANAEDNKTSPEDPAARRGLWEWARLGSGRMGIIGRRPQTEWKAPGIITAKAATSKLNGALGGRITEGSGSLDDFSLISSTVSEPGNDAQRRELAAAKLEGLGISNSSGSHGDHTLFFSQTKKSSDDLVASLNDTPSPNAIRADISPREKSDTSPVTSSPQPQNEGNANTTNNQQHGTIGVDDDMGKDNSENDRQENDTNETDSNNEGTDEGDVEKNTPSRHRIPTYKIMLNSNILSPARRAVSAAYNSNSTST